jgi:8-oxo-dGTP diphosphatase
MWRAIFLKSTARETTRDAPGVRAPGLAGKKEIRAVAGERAPTREQLFTMTHIHVACGIIERGGLVLAARRGASKAMGLKWEFPGGKIEPGESVEECVRRELWEEMGICVCVKAALPLSTHHYPDFCVTLYPLVCEIESGEIVLNEHAAIKWLSPGDLRSLDWAEADFAVIDSYLVETWIPAKSPPE